MTDKEKKIKEIKEFIQKNPNFNSNETLREIRLLGLGIRKQEFQKLFRETKKIPEPTKEKREKSIPIKFRIKVKKPIKKKVKKPKVKTKEAIKKEVKEAVKKEVEKQKKQQEKDKKELKTEQSKITDFPDKPKKAGKYGVIEVIDKEGNSFWIKYQNQEHFNEQLEKLKPSIQSDNLEFISHGFREYIDFIDESFMNQLQSEGILQ